MSTREIYFTSDTHFYHTNAIKHTNRPYACADEMNADIIKKWNEVVKPQDVVYHLGDFTWKPHTSEEILSQLKGEIHIVLGNHDKRLAKYKPKFASVNQSLALKIDDQYVHMSHFPFHSWDRSHHGSINLHGHCHGGLLNFGIRRMDVGVDCNGFTPVSWGQVKEHIKSRDEETDYYQQVMDQAIQSFKEFRNKNGKK